MSSLRASLLLSAAFAFFAPAWFCLANASSEENFLDKSSAPERITLQYRIERDAIAPSRFIVISNVGWSLPAKLIWELPKPESNEERKAQEQQKEQLDQLIKTLEEKGINGVEFECIGQWFRGSLKVMSVPQLTESGKLHSSLGVHPRQTVSEEEYKEISLRIFQRITKLKGVYPSLRKMTHPAHYEYEVKWILDDPTRRPDRLNARRAVFAKDGYWFSLRFYRGEWAGAAVFHPIEFGDLKLWFQFGHGGNASVIAAVTSILREENDAFCVKHPWQRRDSSLQKTGKSAP